MSIPTVQQAQDLCEAIIENVERVIVGKRSVIEDTLVCLLAGGHILLEDVPGVAKTMLAKALAASVNGKFSRLQFTPDLLPSDVMGVNIYNQKTSEFTFRRGPVFTNILLADEINRASPRTQSALLESMEERQVTVDGVTYPLPDPFLVIATENPIEHEGVYALPESQLDRFMMKLNIGYPTREQEKEIVQSQLRQHPIEQLGHVTTIEEIQNLQAVASECDVDDEIYDYVMDIVELTRRSDELILGASPRGTLAMVRCSQALATLQGRDYVIPDDIKRLVTSTLAHRIQLAPQARMGDMTASAVLGQIIEQIPVPV
ncbi:MAG: MoxR family ATPase [Armatimonadota bacterium]